MSAHIDVLSSSLKTEAVDQMPAGISQISCPRCGEELDHKRNICTACGLLMPKSGGQLVPSYRPVELDVQGFAVSGDLSGCRAIESIPLLPSAIEWWVAKWNTPQTRTELLGQGVRVTERQLPQIHELLQAGARRLDCQLPELFVRQDPPWNAWTVGTNECAVVVLHSALLNELQLAELSFVLSHELGHIKCRHVTYRSLARGLTDFVNFLGIPFSRVLTAPLCATISHWERQTEYTADRAGLIGSANLHGAVSALVMLALGSRKFLPGFNFPEYLLQANELECLWGRFTEWAGCLDHPPTVQRARSVIQFAASDAGLAIFKHLDKKGLLNTRPSVQKQLPASTVVKGKQLESKVPFCRKCGFELDSGRADCVICGHTN